MAAAVRGCVVALLLVVVLIKHLRSNNFSLHSAPHKENALSATLKFRSTNDGSHHVFKILQLADLHFGEAEYTDWGPMQDMNSTRVVRSVLQAENPDFVVLSGDQLTANDIDNNATVYYRQLIRALQEAQPNIQWCMVFGNHDDTDLETLLDNGTIIYTPAKTKRANLLKLDMEYSGSWTSTTPGLFGTSNYVVPLFLENETVVDLILFDSGGGSLPMVMKHNQIEWFRNLSAQNNRPAVAFQHIPTDVAGFHYNNHSCKGSNENGGVSVLDRDPGVLDALAESGRVHFLATGHNHGNDFCCPHAGHLSVCYGRHSGYGGYGTWQRGARVYELELKNDTLWSTSTFSWRSWVRLESGQVIDYYSPVTHTPPYKFSNGGKNGIFPRSCTLELMSRQWLITKASLPPAPIFSLEYKPMVFNRTRFLTSEISKNIGNF